MTRLVVLERAELGAEQHYNLRLGPMWFLWPADTITESLGDGLEAIGAVLTAAERRPRPLKLKLPVRASARDAGQTLIGLRMRRQVRQLLDNARWRMSGLYLSFGADPDLDGWVLVGGGDLAEADPGLSFGDFELELTDLYVVARPGTHKPARRMELADRRTGLVPRDTRGLIYSTDFDAQPLPAAPLMVPGDVLGVLGAQNRTPGTITAGSTINGRVLWRAAAADPGEVVSYLPDDAILPDRRRRYIDLDDPGSVRVWTLDNATEWPPTVPSYSTERDLDPTLYGWERAYGDVLAPTTRFAIDNGVCRLIWRGGDATTGLVIEAWNQDAQTFARWLRVLAGLGFGEARVVEVTGERAVIEWRAGSRAMRAILQRGWDGPRLEAYDDDGGQARLEFAATSSAQLLAGAAQTPSWVKQLVYRRNRLTNPSAEVDTAGWTPRTNSTVAASAAQAKYGAQSFALTRKTDAGGPALIYMLQNVPVTVGTRYSLAGWTRAASTPRQTYVSLLWLDSGNATISTSTGTKINDSTSAWTRVSVNGAIAPAGAVNVSCRIYADLAAEGETHYLDGLVLMAANTALDLPAVPDMPMLFAPATATDDLDTTPQFVSGDAQCFKRDRALVVQVGLQTTSASDLASVSLCDAQAVPTVVAR